MAMGARRGLRWLEQPRERFALALGLGVFLYLVTGSLYHEMRLLLSYDATVGVYLGLLVARMLRTDADCAAIFPRYDEPAGLLYLGLALVISAVGLFSVGFLVENDPSWPRWLHDLRLLLCLVAIFLSWLMLNTGFASHYARLYFEELAGTDGPVFRQGLDIPNKDRGDFWDFLYYSFTIAMCYQTSDISVTDAKIRRFTLVHAVISFLYVAVIFGLVVNVISNIV